ncbi:hypothetical protein A5320_08135 [Rheinheimera sp. SA_1]|uniref:hypothetical protein n=1 Tax=Rheinheimera sp. SA_1 TaxID=1827365 RepID=UPI0007FFCD6B|nr:hypothetical protein [Rheinheimera sp. SA_1]OBP15323.1 hypothetical protein A5320_08135 [Rheinheimera sp. SA_1]
MLKNKPLMIAVILVLASLQFLWVPWYDAQQEKVLETTTVLTRQMKIERLLEQKEQVSTDLVQLKKVYSDQLALLLVAEDEQTLGLRIQQDFNKRVADHNLQLEFFNWGVQGNDQPSGLQRGLFTFRVSGALTDIVSFGHQLDQQLGLKVISMNFDWRGNLALDKKTNVTFNIELLYQVVAP